MIQYKQGKLDITIPPAEERIRIRYEALKDSYLDLLEEKNRLKRLIENTRRLLDIDLDCHCSSRNETF